MEYNNLGKGAVRTMASSIRAYTRSYKRFHYPHKVSPTRPINYFTPRETVKSVNGYKYLVTQVILLILRDS